jgi:mono/diheme cytochrome c family protein
MTNGDARRGLATLKKYECAVCHVIPGVRGAQGYVGPSLAAYQRNLYIAGKYPNTSAYLIPWIMDTPALAPLTAMPSLGLSVDEAHDIAAYLYTLH